MAELFFVSFICLFLELLLIRWISVEIRIFAYFRNLVLIASFLGLGLGFNLKKPRLNFLTALVLIAVIAAAVHPRAEFHGLSFRNIPSYLTFTDYNVWYSGAANSGLRIVVGFGLTLILFTALALVFIPFGQTLGEIFESSNHRVRDYSVNLAGSLLGTWGFTLLSYFTTPPWIWFLAGAGGTVALIRPRSRKTIVGLACLVPILLLTMEHDTETKSVYWSPYQKLTLQRLTSESKGERISYRFIEINSVLYMYLLDLSPAQVSNYPKTFNPAAAPYYPYDLPFRFKPHPAQVLIVGAGAGNDAAAALRNGARQVTAVEIDPVIALLGRLYHPEHPYADPRVKLVIDDARSFFTKDRQRYDLIILALLDSHTLTSNFTNINLDSYLYTRESFEQAKQHLAPGGVMALSFQVAHPWLGEKLYALDKTVFQRPPLVISNYVESVMCGTGGTLFLSGDMDVIMANLAKDPNRERTITNRVLDPSQFESRQAYQNIPTDDWPYLYLKSHQVPTFYLVMMGAILIMILLAVRFLLPARRVGPSHFFYLGAGFMLIEAHSITKAALLFGSTWIVNTVIISSILVMILLANLVALRQKVQRVGPWYAGLFLCLALNWLVPIQSLLVGPYLLRGLLAGAFYCLPLFFAGVIFANSIRSVAGVEAAFAANMLGAAIGGMLDNISFITGLRTVVLVAIVLYLASALAWKKMPRLDAGTTR
jgi:SAM-dependent methyltransferase